MQATFTTWPVSGVLGAYGYTVETDATTVHQDRIPGASGRQPMTESQATAYAQALVAELTAPSPSPEA